MDTHSQQDMIIPASLRREMQAHLERLNLYWWLYSLHNPQISKRMDKLFNELMEGQGTRENLRLFVAMQQADVELFTRRLQMETMPPESWYRSVAQKELDQEIGWFWDQFGVDLNLPEFFDPLNFQYIYPGHAVPPQRG